MAKDVIGIAVFFIGLTALAVIVSKRSNTAKVIQSIVDGFVNIQKAAISPVTK